jgi:hypothetical protein
MTRSNDELNEFGRQALEPLRATPPIDPKAASEAKRKFLLQGENLREVDAKHHGAEGAWQVIKKHDIFWMLRQKPVMKSLAAILLVFAFILAGSSITVYASQSSLPGEPLYGVKSWSEDVRIAMSTSPNAKLSLTLNYTNRRVEEISILLANGKPVNEYAADRFQKELEDSLQLATQLDDTQMQHALGEIIRHAEKQGITMKELISKLPPEAKQAAIKLQERLNEQVQLSNVGETNPKEFRIQVRERLHDLQRAKHAPDVDQSQPAPDNKSFTPVPEQDGNHNGDKNIQPNEIPGEAGPGDDHGQSNPGNGNSGKNPTHTPKP